ncbi:desumoylating isopeptidase 1 [Pancytospora philotis]|nr:desumoylating isopeptidase 1 [Pancytospora philotis]KAI4292292.1 desumoylating isopeptidase 1 [Pancytospora philotis]
MGSREDSTKQKMEAPAVDQEEDAAGEAPLEPKTVEQSETLVSKFNAIRVDRKATVASNGETGVGTEEVFLRVYDLSRGAAKAMSKTLLGFQVDGVWHTAIEIYGQEYYFQNGLVCQKAGTTHYGECIERLSLGHTNCLKDALDEFFEASRHVWTPAAYDLFENNCNNFSNYLADFLVSKSIPAHILELPELVKKSPLFAQFFGRNANNM